MKRSIYIKLPVDVVVAAYKEGIYTNARLNEIILFPKTLKVLKPKGFGSDQLLMSHTFKIPVDVYEDYKLQAKEAGLPMSTYVGGIIYQFYHRLLNE